jgi:amidase
MKVGELTKVEQQKLVYDMFEASLTYTPFTQLANLTGQPAISVPVHLTAAGLPLGVQFMAPKGKEDWLLQLAAQIEQSELWIGMKGNPLL